MPSEVPSPMPIKKSELYSKLWQSCDELRGGMDAFQYKDRIQMSKPPSPPFSPTWTPSSLRWSSGWTRLGR